MQLNQKSKIKPAKRRALAIAYAAVGDLKPDPTNPRLHSKKQIRQIAKSIETFGFNIPIVVDSKRRVIAGHGRLEAAKLLRITQVPIILLEHLTEAQIRAFMIADNRLTENSAWDDRLLAEQLRALAEVELDFDLEVIGFEIAEIDTMIEGISPVPEGEADPADALIEAGVRVSKPGDMWLLDRHRVLCGDALKDESFRQLMEGRRAAAVFTDPPFNLVIGGYVAGFGKVQHREFAMASGELSEAEFTEFLFKVCTHLARNSQPGSLHFICLDWRHMGELLAAARRVFSEFKALCVWNKGTGGQGSLYRSQHELVFVFKSGKAKHRNNIQLGQFGRYRTNIWTYPRVNSLGRTGEEDLAGAHPTIKPVALVADAIMDCTARGEIVLDPFLGSGTTVIAAERIGRICYGTELDPGYVDLIVRRGQAFTGKDAVLASSGRTFNEIEEELEDEKG